MGSARRRRIAVIGAGLFGVWLVFAVGLWAYARSDAAFDRWVMNRGAAFALAPEADGGIGEVESKLHALHKGRLPCLRHSYTYRPREHEVRALGTELLALGLEPQVVAELVGQFLLWTDEREVAAHRETASRELAQVLGEGQPLTAFVLWVQLDRLDEAFSIRASEHHEQGQRIFGALTPAQQRALRTLWEENPQHFTIASIIPLLESMRRDVTRQRLSALARAIRERFDRGELDEVKLEALAREAGVPAEDGWGNALSLHDRDGYRVVVRSHALAGDAEELSREVLRPGAPRDPQSRETASPSGCDGAPGTVEFPLAEYHAALDDLEGLSRSARVVPAVERGAMMGFKLFAIRPGSLFARAGLCDGDVVLRVNGFELSSPDRAMDVYASVKRSSDVKVELLRGGEPGVLDVRIR